MSSLLPGGLFSGPVPTGPAGPDLLSGRSGFRLERLGHAYLTKHSDPGSADRLARQYRKQRRLRVAHPIFAVAQAFDGVEDEAGFRFTMPYYRGLNAVQFVDRARPGEVLDLGRHCCELIGEFEAASTLREVPASLVAAKSRQTVEAVEKGHPGLLDGALVNGHLQAVERLGTFLLPIGRCHGDLTFSNVIFERRPPRVVLIDCLDTYLESPVLDAAKVLQETALCWSSAVATRSHDRHKYRIAMTRLDVAVRVGLRGFAWFRDYGAIFETQNLLRLLPYLGDPGLLRLVVDRLRRIEEETPCV